MYLKHFLGMACFAALHGLHMVVNSSSSDKCIFIIRISYLPTKSNSSIEPTERKTAFINHMRTAVDYAVLFRYCGTTEYHDT